MFAPGLHTPAVLRSSCRSPFHFRFATAHFYASVVLLLSLPVAAQAPPATPGGSGPAPAAVHLDYGKLPLSFEANHGQTDPQVRYISRGKGYSLFLTDKEAVLALRRPAAKSAKARTAADQSPPPPAKSDVVRMRLLGAASGLRVTAIDKLPGTTNYFLGSDPARWQSDVPTYARVQYSGVYPGVDLVYYGNQQQLEYDFVVAPHADAASIRLQLAGARSMKLDAEGNLNVVANNGEITFNKPVVYQERDGKREPVTGEFQLLSRNRVGFRLGQYDRERAVIIDPTLVYSTYLGGTGYHIPAGPDCCGDVGYGIAVDSAGNAYVTGQTGSTDFPTMKPVQAKLGAVIAATESNVFIAKLNAAGSALLYSTYLGGRGDYWWYDAGLAIAVDGSGSAYVTGYTGSPNFPHTKGAYITYNRTAPTNARSAFVTKLSPAGNSMVYSTLLSGTGVVNCCGPGFGDIGEGIAVDAAGEAFVGGTAYSIDFPTTAGAYQRVNHAAKIAAGSNAFVTKLNAAGSGLIYSTYVGGSGYSENCCYFFSGGDLGTALAIDGTGSAYLTGYAHSKTDFPVSKTAYQKQNNAHSSLNATGAADINAFITKLNPSGTNIEYSTYLGGSGNPYYGDEAFAIAVDPTCHAYVTGQAASPDFPTKSAYQAKDPEALDEESAFVTKLNTDGSDIVYSTYVGGSGGHRAFGEYGLGIAVDASGEAYLTGMTESADFPHTSNAYMPTNPQTANPGADYYTGADFLTRLDPTGTKLVYSTFFGGSNGDKANGIAIDTSGNAYITGGTTSGDMRISSNAYQKTNRAYAAGNTGSSNAFIVKMNTGPAPAMTATTTSVTADSNPAASNVTITFTAFVQQGTACGFAPTGDVSFVIDGGPAVKAALDATGHAAYSISTLKTGKHTVSATYLGDTHYTKSASATLTETVLTPPATVAALSGSGQIAVYGTAYAKPLVVLVKNASGAALPGVPVTFTGTGLKFSPATVISAANGEASVIAIPAATGTLTAIANASDVSAKIDFTLVATKAVLTITAKPVSVPYGKPIPALTYTPTGFKNGDTAAVLTGTPAESTTAKQDSPVGSYRITITKGTLAAANYTFVFVGGKLTITLLGVASKPFFSPGGGAVYTGDQVVTIIDTTPGAVIHYTTNGSTPTVYSTRYTTTLKVASTETIKALAVAPGYSNSPVASAGYVIKTVAPFFTPQSGIYTTPQTVTIQDQTAGSVIHYTLNGTVPTASSPRYSAPLKVTKIETIKAIAVATGQLTSGLATATYDIKVATPTFTPAAGTYTTPQTVTIKDATAGAIIYYTTNGAAPTTTSTKYTGGIKVSTKETIKAIGVLTGQVNSTTGVATYTIP